MSKTPPPMREIVTLELEAPEADTIFQTCKANGFPQTGEGVVSLLLALIAEDDVQRDYSRQPPPHGEPQPLAASVAEFLLNPANREMLKDVGTSVLRGVLKK